jgi:signal peptidase II
MMETKTQNRDISPGSAQRQSNHQPLAIADLKAHIIFWSLAAGGLMLDLWSKGAVFDWLKSQQNQEFSVIDGLLRLRSAVNDGAAWGLLGGKGYFLSTVSIVALVAILVIFFVSRRQQVLIHIALGLLAAGVSGNLYDRIFNEGRVRDFIDVHHNAFQWPIFNVADGLLCIGVGLLLISNLFIGRPGQKHGPQQK